MYTVVWVASGTLGVHTSMGGSSMQRTRFVAAQCCAVLPNPAGHRCPRICTSWAGKLAHAIFLRSTAVWSRKHFPRGLFCTRQVPSRALLAGPWEPARPEDRER